MLQPSDPEHSRHVVVTISKNSIRTEGQQNFELVGGSGIIIIIAHTHYVIQIPCFDASDYFIMKCFMSCLIYGVIREE